MPGDYFIKLQITVFRANPQAGLVTETQEFKDLSFSQMTRISSQYYELLPKLEKETKQTP